MRSVPRPVENEIVEHFHDYLNNELLNNMAFYRCQLMFLITKQNFNI